tara:strand:- start:82 stop:771 length:690 start_codon:yes stop_codon:yes gene_type:complete
MSVQLVLGVQLPSSATLEAFVGDVNAGARASIAQIIEGRSERLFLAGPESSGKTHLLQAACRAIGDAGQRSCYLPLAQVRQRLKPLVENLAEMDCVCIDDIDAIAGQREAEIALVGLSDALRARGSRLVAAGSRLPRELGLALPDLATRLAWGGAVCCRALDDDDKIALLVERGAQRGMTLPEPTARWILKHGASDVPALMNTLDTLDRASLSAQRRLTIPFVRETLAQ